MSGIRDPRKDQWYAQTVEAHIGTEIRNKKNKH